jgi:uncharacterized protein (DUF58 family)
MKGTGWWALLAALLLVAVITRRGLLSVFVIVLALATIASELWSRYCLSNLFYRRRLGSDHLAYGEETSLQLEIVNAKPLPLAWLRIQDRFPQALEVLTGGSDTTRVRYTGELATFLSLRWYQRVTRTHRIKAVHRGVFALGPARLSSGDVFGMRWREREDPSVDTLVVYPKVVPLETLGLPAERPLGERAARRRIVEDPLRFATLRDYLPGDNPRYIHWKATAHRGTVQTQVFEPCATLSLVVAVDVQTLERTFEQVPEYLEYVVSAAASLLADALDQRYQAGLCANGLGESGQRWLYIPPGRHPAHLATLLSALAALGPFRGVSIAELLHRIMPLLPLGATLAAVSAMPGDDLYVALLALQEAGHPVVLLTVGDEPPSVPERFETYHLGGRHAWRQLQALCLV